MKGRIHGQTAHWCPLLCPDQWLNRTCVLFLTMCSYLLPHSCSHSFNTCPCHEIWQSMPTHQLQHEHQFPKALSFLKSTASTTLSFPWLLGTSRCDGSTAQLQMGPSRFKQQFELSNLLLQWENCDHSSISSLSSQAFSIITFSSFPVLSEKCLPYWSVLLPLLALLHFFWDTAPPVIPSLS